MKKEKLIIEEISERLDFDIPVLRYNYGVGGSHEATGERVLFSMKVVNPEKLAKFLSKYVDIKAEDLVE